MLLHVLTQVYASHTDQYIKNLLNVVSLVCKIREDSHSTMSHVQFHNQSQIFKKKIRVYFFNFFTVKSQVLRLCRLVIACICPKTIIFSKFCQLQHIASNIWDQFVLSVSFLQLVVKSSLGQRDADCILLASLSYADHIQMSL